MTKHKSDIIEMKAVHRADGGVMYQPVRNRQADPAELTVVDAAALAEQQARAQPVQERLTGSYRDRAIGFSIKTWQISALVGVGLWLLARVAADVPLLSIKAILILLAGAGVVWGIAFALDLLISPAGVALYNARRLWNHIDREQAERHRRFGGD